MIITFEGFLRFKEIKPNGLIQDFQIMKILEGNLLLFFNEQNKEKYLLMTENLINIDWIHVSVTVTHDPKLISRGIVLHLNNDWNVESATHHYKPQTLRSSFDNTLWIKPHSTGAIEISGNFYKFLNHHNVTGSNDLVGLVTDLVKHLSSLDLGINPTDSEWNDLREGRFRLFRVDVNKAILLSSKDEALNYLNHLKKNASYPYRAKTIYSNGLYFGMKSKRWALKFYHKGTEVLAHKADSYPISDELLALADLMVRAEIRINAHQLREWDLMFGHQWQIGSAERLLDSILRKLILPDKPNDSIDSMRSTIDRKFYRVWMDGEAETYYSTRTIQRYRTKFLKQYGINIQQSTTI